MRELAFISTDLVCLQDVEAGLTRPGGRLLSMLAEHGYSARFVLTPCDTSVRTSIDHQSSAVARATILLYRTDVFTELGYRIRPVDKIAKSVCSYQFFIFLHIYAYMYAPNVIT
ncbi:unnamed protein product [Protopolystoma xenopodis]|uniref:Uncharacterized protein n=1 Tax=Protopolystoma xenopodis TaxID=117903 RepID=A0A448WH08_9PLAT|nr:unnamed protein product [Protopolystoma xenopodis]